jgi:glyceraldehyde 3-phosphate dehydrogenase
MTQKVVKVAINGFGRIGRLVARILTDRKDFQLMAVNDLAPPETLGHLLRYDSTHRKFPYDVRLQADGFVVDGREIKALSEKDPARLPWKDLGVDFVVEATGVFRHRELIAKHIEAGAPRVLLTVPAKDEIDATIVMGVNEKDLKGTDRIISNASCTTNCLAPVAMILHKEFGIEHGLMTTVHAYTNDQRILDLVHKDLRRARSAAVNIIPTTTGAARAVGKVIPELNGKLNGMAVRVPVEDGSLVDLTVRTQKEVTVETVNEAMRNAAAGPLEGILAYSEEPLVSQDIIGNPHSSIFDALSTMVMGKNLLKIITWYDNEWGYANRVVDLMAFAVNSG